MRSTLFVLMIATLQKTSSALLHTAGGRGLLAKNVILYDGVCNFCNFWVDTVRKFDHGRKFQYSALQSTDGKQLLQKLGKKSDDLSTVIYIRSLYDQDQDSKKSEVFMKSDAALQVASDLGVPNTLVNSVATVFPKLLRDKVYDFVANNRYRILGKREECNCGDVLNTPDQSVEVCETK